MLKLRTEISQAAIADNDNLDLAIEIGVASGSGFASPILKDAEAATCAYLLLKTGWPEDRIREKLIYFQSGQGARRARRKQPLLRRRENLG